MGKLYVIHTECSDEISRIQITRSIKKARKYLQTRYIDFLENLEKVWKIKDQYFTPNRFEIVIENHPEATEDNPKRFIMYIEEAEKL